MTKIPDKDSSDSSLKFFETIADEGAKSLFQLVWSFASTYGKNAIAKVAISRALQKYAGNYMLRHGEIKVLNMSAPIPLTQIYTKVRLVQPSAEHSSIDITTYESRFWQRHYHFEYGEKREVTDVIKQYSRLNILGAPGAGKSTLLKRIGLYALEGESIELFGPDHVFMPVLIELKQFNGNPVVDILQAIQHEFEIAGFPESGNFVKHALTEGKLLILLDGLDEVPRSSLDQVVTAIKDLTHQYPSNRFITSCRTAYYKNYLKGFTDIQVADFDNEQIKSFIVNWFNTDKDQHVGTAERLTAELFDEARKATLELARTPLLLTFLCVVFDSVQQFPANRSSLYRRAMEILLERWAAEKRIHQEEIYQNLNSDLEIQMLSEIAAYFYEKEKTLFYSDELKERISQFLENTMGVKLPPTSKVLEAIEVQQGLLVQRMIDVYSFSHLTIQEYLTAFYYFSPTKMPILIQKHLFDKKWREVFILQAGMSHSEDLLLLMSRHLKVYSLNHPILKSGIDWVNRVARSDNSPGGVWKRVMLLSILIRYRRKKTSETITHNSIGSRVMIFSEIVCPTCRQAFVLPKHSGKQSAPLILEALEELTGKTNRTKAIMREIQAMKPSRPLKTMMPGSKLSFNKKVFDTILKGYGVPEEFLSARSHTLTVLENYIEGMTLISECSVSALRVSPTTWSAVLANFVR